MLLAVSVFGAPTWHCMGLPATKCHTRSFKAVKDGQHMKNPAIGNHKCGLHVYDTWIKRQISVRFMLAKTSWESERVGVLKQIIGVLYFSKYSWGLIQLGPFALWNAKSCLWGLLCTDKNILDFSSHQKGGSNRYLSHSCFHNINWVLSFYSLWWLFTSQY